MHGTFRRVLLAAVLGAAVVSAAVAPSSASATPVVVTSDRTEMVVPFTLLQKLNPDNIRLDVVSPATLAFPNFPIPLVTFPVTGGLIDDGTMIGTVNHAGGQRIYRLDETGEGISHELEVLNFRIVNGNQLWGDTAGLLPGPAASLENASHTVNPQTGEIIFKAEAHLDPVAAQILNLYFETTLFEGGMLLGNLTSYINSPPGYPRPKSASTIDIPFVPSYQPCEFPSFPNRRHAAPLTMDSCAPPATSSSFLTTGTPDANGQPAQFRGSVKLKALLGDPATATDEADVGITATFTDVRKKDASLSDYDGQVLVRLPLRATDSAAGPDQDDTATGQNYPFDVVVPCVPTPLEAIGSACVMATTADSIAPGAVREGKRTIWETDQIRVYDGGSTGVAGSSDATVFAVQGVFAP